MVEIKIEEINFEPQVTKENLSVLRKQVASLRETKGEEKNALRLSSFVRKEAEKLEQWEDVVYLWWEDHLIWQHTVMHERDKLDGEANEVIIKEAMEKMESATVMADYCIRKYKLEDLKADSFRYLGRVKTYQGEHSMARAFYEEGISLYEKMNNSLRKVRRLELQGFLAHSMVMEGELKEGIKLAISTFNGYDKADEAIKLKEVDYYTWAVWKSGAVINLCHALINKGQAGNYQAVLDQLLDEAESVLVIPEGDKTWGDKNFEFRKDEFRAIKRKLEE